VYPICMVDFVWPAGFPRVPADEWTLLPVESLARKYDTVENHGWYKNLEPTVAQLLAYLKAGDVLIDYSGGTGILADRLLRALGDRPVGIVIVDASPKFLRLALDKFRVEPRVALRHIRYLKGDKRLERVDEVLEKTLLDRRVDAIVSTNAIHLYYDLADTLASWFRVLRAGGAAFVQSGNIRNPQAQPGEWIIDETVHAISDAAVAIVRRDARYEAYRAGLEDAERMAAYAALRDKFFLPVRPLAYYTDALTAAGFTLTDVTRATIEAKTAEWFDFLAVYHEGVLGWVGGSERVEGEAPTEEAVRDRLALIREAMHDVFQGRDAFECCWTYVRCAR
jgi:ubiquinone/menaquinone biosynthesis C-methylase UbiE